MRVDFDDLQEHIQVTENTKDLINKVIQKCLEHENIDNKCEIGITFVNNEQIRELNNEFRELDKSTDVLSFPLVDFTYEQDDKFCYDDDYLMLGDIVISLQKAEEQSRDYGHSLEREIGYLCVHSTLHLLGYDHDNEQNTKLMREKEEAILESLSLTRD